MPQFDVCVKKPRISTLFDVRVKQPRISAPLDVILPSRTFFCDISVVNLKVRDGFNISSGIGMGCDTTLSAEKDLAAKVHIGAGVKASVLEQANLAINSGIGVGFKADGFGDQFSIDSVHSGINAGVTVSPTLSRIRMLSDLPDTMLSDVNAMTLQDFYYIEI